MNLARLGDGVIFLRPLQLSDALAHLAGEDEEIAKYLSGGRSTAETVRAYIERCLGDWRNNGPKRAFGIFGCTSGSLVGSVEADLTLPVLKPGQVNISYGVFAPWRGQGIAARAIRLLCDYLRNATHAHQVIVRTVPGNQPSARVAEKLGFHFEGIHYESEQPMLIFSLDFR